MNFRQATLSNGLEIVAETNKHAYSLAVAYFVKAGSRDETPILSGVSHFLEHMTFKGTARRSAADVNRELDEMGSHSNAFTSEEQTVYYATVLPEFQQRIVDLLTDIMRPALRIEDFETEKQVILEEILKYEDQPPFGAHEKCMALYFQDHPLGNSVLGTEESVSQLTAAAMRDYFNSRYVPTNMVLAAAGQVDFDRLVEQAEKTTEGWEPGQVQRSFPPVTPHADRQSLLKPSSTQQYVVQIGPGPDAEDEDRFAAQLLATVIGDDTGSRFYWDLVETGRAEYAGMNPYEFQRTGITMSYFCCAPETTADNLQRVARIVDQVQQQAKNKTCSYVVRQSERPSNRLFSIGNNWVQRRQYETVEQRVAAYQRVTLDDIRRVLERFPLNLQATVTVGPLAKF